MIKIGKRYVNFNQVRTVDVACDADGQPIRVTLGFDATHKEIFQGEDVVAALAHLPR